MAIVRARALTSGGRFSTESKGDPDLPPPPSPGEYGAAVAKGLAGIAHLDITLLCEPGRVIIGQAGVLVTRVLYRKHNEAKHFTIIDAAFNDRMRPALYGSYHPMEPVRRVAGRPEQVTDIVGPICETSDFLARDRALPALEAGELLAVKAAGAYGAAMSSSYKHPAPRGGGSGLGRPLPDRPPARDRGSAAGQRARRRLTTRSGRRLRGRPGSRAPGWCSSASCWRCRRRRT